MSLGDHGEAVAGGHGGDEQVGELDLPVVQRASGGELAEHPPRLPPVSRIEREPRAGEQGRLDGLEVGGVPSALQQLHGEQGLLASVGVVSEPVWRVVPYVVPLTEDGSMAITASEARKNLFPLIEQVNEDRTPVEITSRRGDAVLISRADYDSLEATAHLLRAPANARRLLESLQQALSGQRDEHELSR